MDSHQERSPQVPPLKPDEVFSPDSSNFARGLLARMPFFSAEHFLSIVKSHQEQIAGRLEVLANGFGGVVFRLQLEGVHLAIKLDFQAEHCSELVRELLRYCTQLSGEEKTRLMKFIDQQQDPNLEFNHGLKVIKQVSSLERAKAINPRFVVEVLGIINLNHVPVGYVTPLVEGQPVSLKALAVADWEDEHLKEEYLAYLADLEKNRISVDKNSQGNNVIVQTNSQGQINGFRLIDLG